MAKPLFEHHECGRCGGSGRMPFSVANGVCFGCGGSGGQLTKRGAAAQRYLDDLRSVPVANVKVGDKVWIEIFLPGGNVRSPIEIDRIETGESGSIEISGIRKKDGSRAWHFGTTVRPVFLKEAEAELRAKALDYQATLTKAGTPRKRAA